MRARGRGMTWWARTAQKSGSRLLPNAAVPVWLSSAFKERTMAPDENLAPEAPCPCALIGPRLISFSLADSHRRWDWTV